MNIPFDIVKGKGPIIFDPLRTAEAVNQVRICTRGVRSICWTGSNNLEKRINNEAAVLDFVRAPITLASYCVEGSSSKHFTKIKQLAFTQPKVLHALLQKFATSMAKCIHYQADNEAQAVQISLV